MSSYFKNISEGIGTTLKGMGLTWGHLWQARKRRTATDVRKRDFFDLQTGMVTIQYPQETIPIPDNGRYRLHNEMDDCIVCDKCVKVCPVDCIEIEPIRAIGEVGKASDGSPIRLYAAKFDIDMAKCCYCGLCTTVCPTECLTMTKTFDYSELDVRDMVYSYANLTVQEADEKRALLQQFQKEKEALKSGQIPPPPTWDKSGASVTPPPIFNPADKPKQPEVDEIDISSPSIKPPKPVFQPRKQIFPSTQQTAERKLETESKLPFKPTMKPKVENPLTTDVPVSDTPADAAINKPAFRPTMKPKVENPLTPDVPVSDTPADAAINKPAFRPTMKPKVENPLTPDVPVSDTLADAAINKPAFRPTMKPKHVGKVETSDHVREVQDIVETNLKVIADDGVESEKDEEANSSPSFRPSMKPKPKQE